MPFRLYSLVKDTPKMSQDDYFEDGTNEAYIVHESSRKVKVVWANRGLVLRALGLFKLLYLQVYPDECVILEGFALWIEECTRSFKRQPLAPKLRGRGAFRSRGTRGLGCGGRQIDSRLTDHQNNRSEICRNYNNHCNYPQCSRRHVCSTCQSTLHKMSECPGKQ